MAELEAIAASDRADAEPARPRKGRARAALPAHVPTADGTWRGRFSLRPRPGTADQAGVLAAFSAPRPGGRIDADGVRHDIPDSRDLGARQIDAVTDIITLALAKTGITLPDDHHSSSSKCPGNRPAEGLDTDGPDTDGLDTAGPATPTSDRRPCGRWERAWRTSSGVDDPEYQDAEPDQPPDEPRPARAKAWSCASPGRWPPRTRAWRSWWSPASNTSPPRARARRRLGPPP